MRRLILVLLALVAELPASSQTTPPPPSLREAILVPMSAGFKALQSQHYAEALASFRAAQVIIDRQPLKNDKYDERIVRAATAFLTAKVLEEGKLGKPCPMLVRARTHIDSLTGLARRDPPDASLANMSNEALRDINQADIKYGCAKGKSAVKSSIPPALAGHYYLSGVMETGSELELKPDGSYDYFISYGAVDQFSTGIWRRVGNDIVLTHTRSPADAPLFKLDSLDPWDAEAEGLIQKERYQALVSAIYKRCPFLDEQPANANEVAPPMATAMTPPPMSSLDLPKVDPVAEYRKAQTREASARRAYETAASQMMLHKGDNAANFVDAWAARYDWQEAHYAMLSARNAAELTEDPPPEPRLPAACVVPDKTDAASIPKKHWVRGFAVIVGDPGVEMKFGNVDVTFQFADGTNAARKTVHGGAAWVEKQEGNPVTGIVLNYRGAGREAARPERFAIANAIEGVQRVIIDSRQFAQPPFDELRLTLDGDELIGPGGRGRYAKAR